MTPDNALISSSARAGKPRPNRKTPLRRRATGLLAGLAVVGISAAMMSPTGSAIADPQTDDAPLTAFSLASAETQSITVTVSAAEIAPVTRGNFSVYVKPKPKPTPKPQSNDSNDGKKRNTGNDNSRPKYTGGGSKEQWMTAAGISEGDWAYVDYIVSRESGWNPNATNKSSGACGLVQALPCSKVPGNGYNPVDNLRWGNGYAVGRYGSWANAYSFWKRNHWW